MEEIKACEFRETYEPKHQLGPDHIIPSEELRSWSPDGAVKINVHYDPDQLLKPVSVVTFFKSTVDKFPNNDALAVKRDGEWIKWTYTDYWNTINIAARGFIKLGLQQFHGVGILGFNSPEWMFSHFACVFAGGISAGIYTTNSPDACFHILNDCSANIVVVENELQLEKILKIRKSLPNLKAIIQFRGKPSQPDVLSWTDLMEIGESIPEVFLERRIKGLAINQCAVLIYTSGTTGNPKGVMITHDNATYLSRSFSLRLWKHTPGKEVIMSYLPLSHIAGLLKDMYISVATGSVVYFATPAALKDQVVKVIKDIQPTSFIGVPRIYEKIYEKLQDEERNLGFLSRSLLSWARQKTLHFHINKPSHPTFASTLSQKLIRKKILQNIGLDATKAWFMGGAPISKEVMTYLASFDILPMEGYGLSECTGYHCFSREDSAKIGAIGNINTCPTLTLKVVNPDEDGNGELLLRGRNVSMGYLNLEDLSKELITDDGWVHTGDIGRIDEDGFVYITGRLKELIITSGGENIPPYLIEDHIKKILPVVSQCMLIGDRKKFLTMIITLKAEIDPESALSLDQLSPVAVEWCRSIGSDANTISEILNTNDEKVFGAIQSGIDLYNKELAISSAQKIQKWRIIPDDFSIAGEELGPTMKLKRQFILKKYNDIINSFYD